MAKFEIGKQVVTRGVYNKGMEDTAFLKFVNASFVRFTSGDWGDVDETLAESNEEALIDGGEIIGAYEESKHHWTIMISTGADRKVTQIMGANEY